MAHNWEGEGGNGNGKMGYENICSHQMLSTGYKYTKYASSSKIAWGAYSWI